MKTKSFLTLLSFCLLFLMPLSLCAQEPVCGKCYKKKSNCPYSCNHPKCKTCGKFCGARVTPCPYGGKHPKCDACGKLKENCAYKGKHPTHAGHEYVDLGLSVKWATCNVGASSPTGYGNYYAWGEINTSSEYEEETCKTWELDIGDIGGNAAYDAARANWGGNWRLPTESEFEELIDNCTYKPTTQKGVAGMRFTSKKNGNSIFFPAADDCVGASCVPQRSYHGYGNYWSSTPHGSLRHAIEMHFMLGGDASTSGIYRYYGLLVRPVLE